MCLQGNITPSDWDRIQQGKVTPAVRKAGGVQFLGLLPGAACSFHWEAVKRVEKKYMIGCDGLTKSRRQTAGKQRSGAAVGKAEGLTNKKGLRPK